MMGRKSLFERLAWKHPRTGLASMCKKGWVKIKGKKVVITEKGKKALRRRR